jgi:hypothetical protein
LTQKKLKIRKKRTMTIFRDTQSSGEARKAKAFDTWDVLPEEYRHKKGGETPVRYNHKGCKAGEDTKMRLYVRWTNRGWLYHCHNCGSFSGFQPCGDASPTSVLAQHGFHTKSMGTVRIDNETISLPHDFTTKIPLKGTWWLEKYITKAQIAKYKIGYSPKMDRVILPVYNDNKLEYWQGRSLAEASKDNPKYISMRGKGKDIVFKVLPKIGQKKQVIFVEDVLSAITLEDHVQAVAVLGSHIPDGLQVHCNNMERVDIWLDFDKAKEAIKFSNRIRTIWGYASKAVITTEDPKCYDTQEITDILTEQRVYSL